MEPSGLIILNGFIFGVMGLIGFLIVMTGDRDALLVGIAFLLIGGLGITSSVVGHQRDKAQHRYCTSELSLRADTIEYLRTNPECERTVLTTQTDS